MTHRSFLRIDLFLALSGLAGVAACSGTPSSPVHQETVRTTSAAVTLDAASMGLFPTGVKDDGVQLIDVGQLDPHYTTPVDGNCTGVAYVVTPNDAWVTSVTPATWISCSPNTNGAEDTDFRYTATLNVPPGISASTIEVQGNLACDNRCWIEVNGEAVGNSSKDSPVAPADPGGNGYNPEVSFKIPAGTFKDGPGPNTITFVVHNDSGGVNPTGLLVSDIAVTGGCARDADCGDGNYCNINNGTCAEKLENGDGPCTADNAASVCKSGACDANDSKCGYASGGSCTAEDANTVCRFGKCSTNGTCLVAGACATHEDCGAGKYCATDKTCAVQHANGDGPCTEETEDFVCASGVCGADGNCGYRNGDACNASNQCRSGSFCGADNTCIPAASCSMDADCTNPLTPTCNTGTHKCEAASTEEDAGTDSGTNSGSDAASTTDNASLGGGGSSCAVRSGAQHGAGISSVLGVAAMALVGLLRRRRG